MRRLCLVIALALASGRATAQESAHARAMQAFDQGDYAAAWSLLEGEADAFWQASGRTFVVYGAGDFSQTLRHAETALALCDSDLNVLYRASWAAVQLRDLVRADDFVQRLGTAVAAESFSAEHASFWDQSLAQLGPRVEELRAGAAQRDSALQRARFVSCSGLISALLLIYLLGRR